MSPDLRRLLAEATDVPWRWVAIGPGEGDIALGGAVDPEGEFHILTPSVCQSCRDHGGKCLAPNSHDADLIEAAVNALPALLDVVDAARALRGFGVANRVGAKYAAKTAAFDVLDDAIERLDGAS